MKTPNGHEIIGLFERFSPKSYAMEGDKIGLQIGRLNKPCKKVMIALDVLESVVDEAIEENTDLIIAHHPLIYRPLGAIQTDQTAGRVIEKLIKHDIAVYAAHTNLDVAKGGVNDLLASALHLTNTEVLVPTIAEELRKLAVFVPLDQAEAVREALGKAGAGALGNYQNCSFSQQGEGRFQPGEEAEPFIGQAGGRLETVQEEKIEVIYPVHIEKKVLSAMLKAHPYEEAAYDIYPLQNKGEQLGLGRIGLLPQEMTLEQFAMHVKESLQSGGVRVVGDKTRLVRKVAVLGGDGNKYWQTALRKGADVYVTGDFYYHTAHDADAEGLAVVDPGHNVEKVMKKGVAAVLHEQASRQKWTVEFVASAVETDPFQFM
ncbi:Nif3-like dinuclear metal center hexameric protein [Domibacillus sp. PGB-M46]|uniref:Nif3-like dinuclear metal center hexameric protein n=1 Tax=Domibacillus sp. PGB-M46 TaxID=2910255 RepID=UPI001F55EC76|nr:Nif3-like dinuclear metal center hexameric protein [Domibacillus sp. PGB-M46]MCI2254515.1 Nif3-like dinuclear metal center hexameric protein [Domibacillus sp. PGB-M46]